MALFFKNNSDSTSSPSAPQTSAPLVPPAHAVRRVPPTSVNAQNRPVNPQASARPSMPAQAPQPSQVASPAPQTQNPQASAANAYAHSAQIYSHPMPASAPMETGGIPCESIGLVNDADFSDIYITPDHKCYIWGKKTECGLKQVQFSDFPAFFEKLEKTYIDNPSYLLKYEGRNYRIERTVARDGVQYCARKMPITVPNLRDLKLPVGLYNHLLSLSGRCGLILIAGATGSGKSTTIAALLQEYLKRRGGYCFTIEDPIELPLDGLYVTPSREIGLCKQTVPPNGSWEEGIKSALRSKPKYIYLGEIRSPDIASEALRAATSGHIVVSTIHANNIGDAINALVKYAASSGISEDMAYELVANGFLGCVHQILTGVPKHVEVTYLFANPDVNAGCQVRGMLRNGKLNIATVMEQQKTKIDKNQPLF